MNKKTVILESNALVNLEDVYNGILETYSFIDKHNSDGTFDELDRVRDDLCYNLMANIINLVIQGYTPQDLSIYESILEEYPDELVDEHTYKKFCSILDDLFNKEKYNTNYQKGYQYLLKIAQENNDTQYEIVEDTYKYKHGLLLITYADKEHEVEKYSVCINLDKLGYIKGIEG